MIAFDPAEVIRDQLTEGLEVETLGPDKAIVYMPFLFGDGDQVSVYVTRTGEHTWQLTDEGEVLERATNAGLDLKRESTFNRLRTIVEFYGASEKDGILDMASPSDRLAEAIFTFTQTCLETTWLTRRPKAERQKARRIEFSQKLSQLVARAANAEAVAHKWHDPVHDRKNLYPVDYRIEGRQRQLFLFGVASEQSCMQATLACLHFKNAQVEFSSLAVYDDEGKISKKHAEQLNDVVDRRCPRVSEQRTVRHYIARMIA